MTEITFFFDPTTGDASELSPKEIQPFRNKNKGKKKIVLLCHHCYTIVHQSTIEENFQKTEHRKQQMLIVNSFKNVRVNLFEEKITLMCNQCSQVLGQIQKKSLHVSLLQENIKDSTFSWKIQQARHPKETLAVGSLSGVQVSTLEKLIQKLTYTKYRRYQGTMEVVKRSMKITIKGFQNFILLYNASKKEEGSRKSKELETKKSSHKTKGSMKSKKKISVMDLYTENNLQEENSEYSRTSFGLKKSADLPMIAQEPQW